MLLQQQKRGTRASRENAVPSLKGASERTHTSRKY